MAQALTALGGDSGGEVLSERGYSRLLKDVTKLLVDGRAAAQQEVANVLARTYWAVGLRVDKEKLTRRAGYGAGLLRELSRDLGVGERTLQRAVQFAGMYPDGPKPGLSWAHYQELLSVEDAAVRGALERAAIEGGWSRRQLKEAVRAPAGERMGVQGAKPGKGARGKGGLPRPTDGSYVYGCWVEHVVDGDTLVVQLDLGFEVIRRQRVRLRAVDAAEVGTESREAYRYVLRQLGAAPRVVIKTTRVKDAWGRFEADLFYGTDEGASVGEVFAAGRYLNGELVARGLARRVWQGRGS